MPITEKTYKWLNKSFLIVSAVLALLLISYLFVDIILMLVISLLLALILNPVVTALENKGVNRFIATLFTILVCFYLIFLGFSYVVPQLTDQIINLSTSINQSNIKQFLRSLDKTIITYVPFIKSGTIAGKIEIWISSFFINFLDSLSNLVSSIVSIVAVAVIVPFMTFFLLKDNKGIIKGVLNIMPNRYFEVSYWVIRQISVQLGRFVRGWILDAFFVGVLSAVGLSILGVNNAVPIGVIAGIGHLIPYFGPIIGSIPAMIISIAQFGNFSMIPSILIMFSIVYALDNGFIQPNIFSKSVDMHPLLIIILIIAGSQVMGVFGMLLAVPTATVIRTAAKEIYNGYKNYSIIKK
ncbi:MAG: AI-2E family transporter [Ignavibacteriales bacterium]|nr:AI-2E family transporter [Ignavibacteriales bacterium]